MLSTEIEYYQENRIFLKKTKGISEHCHHFKVNSIDSGFFVSICSASRICSWSLLILSAIIVVFSTLIF